MQSPLEIAFHNVESTPELEAEIRGHFARLEARCDRLTGCRVSVEAPHRSHRKGDLPEVHIVMSVPGKDLVVSREPHHAREHHAHPDVRTSIRDLFKVAERQLDSYKDRRRDDVSVPGASALAGRVALIEPGADHGFILNSAGSQIYFHRDSVTDGRFEDVHEGDVVHYVETDGAAGPVASKVRVGPADRPR